MIKLFSFYKKYDNAVWTLFLSRIITVAGFSLVMPFMSIYLHNELGVPMKIVGIIMMINTGIGALAQLVGGEVSDYFNRKQILVIATFLRGIAFVFISYFVAIRADYLTISLLLTCSSILGFFTVPASNSMISDIVASDQRIDAYGLLRVGTNVGWAIGPVIGGIMATFSYSSLFLLAFLSYFVTGILILVMLKEPIILKEEKKFTYNDLIKVTHNRIFLLFCFFGLLIWLVRGQLTVALSVYSIDRVFISKIQLGYLYTLNGALVIFFQYPVTLFLKKIRMTSSLVIGSICYAVGFMSVGAASSFICLAGSMILITAGELILSPASVALTANMSPEGQKGRYMGIYGFFESIGASMAPLIGGYLLDFFPGRSLSMWAIISIFGFGAALGYKRLKNKIPRDIDLPGA